MSVVTPGKNCPNPNFCYSQGCLGKCEMIDDSLSDVQQEKKQMSVKKLNFVYPEYDCKVAISKIQNRIKFIVTQHGNISAFELEHSEAQLLMLYLQEHLKEPNPLKDYYHCSCGLRHLKNYVCERLGK